ncbi:cyclophilin-like fold protein [Halalkalibacter lacteus]|uniref:cyclophilin-like fold protein n=1 Tax=Halalkalibacter lacteus TaxID=3090663 RepID=UPI003D6656D8
MAGRLLKAMRNKKVWFHRCLLLVIQILGHHSDRLPTDSERPGVINAGEIMLYGDNCLVLLYETFSSSYSYTRLGYIEDVERFAKAVGNGDIRVNFDLVEN